MASNLEKAYKSYGSKKRSSFAKQKRAEWEGKGLASIGSTMMSAAKFYKKSVEPNVQKWKDVEAGYEELGVAEKDRYKPKSFLKVPIEKMVMKPKNVKGISNIESGGRSYNLSDIRGLGAALTDQSADIKRLMEESDGKTMKDFFGSEIKTPSEIIKPETKTTSVKKPIIETLNITGTDENIRGTRGPISERKPVPMIDRLSQTKEDFGSYKEMYKNTYGHGKKLSITDRLFGPMDTDTGARLKSEKDYEEYFRRREMEQFTKDTELKANKRKDELDAIQQANIEKQNARYKKGKSNIYDAMDELDQEIAGGDDKPETIDEAITDLNETATSAGANVTFKSNNPVEEPIKEEGDEGEETFV